MHYSNKKEMDNKELLQILKDYNKNIGFPTQRVFTAKNGLPSYSMYYDRFGSFKNAILLAGLKIPNERKRFFERESLKDSKIKKEIKKFTDVYITNEHKLPTYDIINNNKELPSTSVIVKRFGSLTNLFKILGYNLDYEKEIFKEKLLQEYKILAKKLNRTPTSRDLDKYSLKNKCCSASTYAYNFGSIYNIQKKIGLFPCKYW